MDDFSKFQGKKRQLSIWHDGLINYLSFYWNWIKSYGDFIARAQCQSLSILPVYCHTFHIRIYDIAAFQSSGRRAPWLEEIKTLLIPDEMIKNLQLNRNRIVLIRFQPQ